MKYLFITFITLVLISCNSKNKNQTSDSKESISQPIEEPTIPLILPSSMENRRLEFQGYINSAIESIKDFAESFGWENLTQEDFIDSVMIFDEKNKFNIALLKLVGEDTMMVLPDTYCAALEKRTLTCVTPEIYSKVYPQGIEENSYEKLMTHEIAHRLHIRILNGDEDAMGPIWFYEGFAMYVANQFSKSDITLTKEEMIAIMKDPNRGSYLKYNYIFRYFVKKRQLKELIFKAEDENFNDELILMID